MILKNVFLFFVFIPFINILPFLKIETPPNAGFISIVIIIAYFYNRNHPTTPIAFVFAPAFLLISIFLFRFDHFSDSQYIIYYFKTVIGILLGYSVLLSTIIIYPKINLKTLIPYIQIWIVVGILLLSPFSGILNSILESILTRSVAAIGTRGIQILANEPSYAGIYLSIFIILIELIYIQGFIKNRERWLLILVIIFLIFMTRSANAILLLFGYILLIVWKNKRARKYMFLLFLIVMPLSYYYLLENEFESRVLILLQVLIKNPSIIMQDASISSRFWLIYISYYGAFENYLVPNGVGSYSYAWETLARQLNIIDIYEIDRNLGKRIAPLSFLGGISHDYGIFGLLLFIPLIFYPSIKMKKSKYWVHVSISSVFVFVLWLQTCSYALPLPWFILGLNYALLKEWRINEKADLMRLRSVGDYNNP